MAQPFFPSVEQIFDIISAELPDGPYAKDRADDPDYTKRSFSSSELRAQALLIAALYENLANINDDKFVSTVTLDGLVNYEREFFSTPQDSTQPYLLRQQNVLAKERAKGGISLTAIKSVISGILGPVDLDFAILPWSGQANGLGTGAWVLGVSSLGFDTYLAGRDPLIGARTEGSIVPLDCDQNYTASGLTEDDFVQIQATAYLYTVAIYGHADNNTLVLLNSSLTALEPARSSHVILNDATPPAAAV